MNLTSIIERMAGFPHVLRMAVDGIPPADLRWRPDPAAWSILDILDHVYLEELRDFGPRLRSTLEDATRSWTPLDPAGSLRERQATTHDAQDTLDAFRDARAASIKWLRGLGVDDWNVAYAHPSIGDLRAGDLLAAWAAHDTLHHRQLVQRRFQLVQRDAAPFSTGYAGDW
jgi:hypothetical protein